MAEAGLELQTIIASAGFADRACQLNMKEGHD
jgi:hypothetical protein